ncbi:unnamed protein product, partial [Didymodactylos carnosus]
IPNHDTIIRFKYNISGWSDFVNEQPWTQSNESGSYDPKYDRIFLLRAHYKTIDCNETRRIWIYLPPDYYQHDDLINKKRYPVVYMHHGEMMFNYHNVESEWKIDTLLNEAYFNLSSCSALRWGFIVVAIESLKDPDKADQEYIVSREESGCHSINNLKTFTGSFRRHIDTTFRTIGQWDYTAHYGVKTSGSMVLHAFTKYYRIIGKFACFSNILNNKNGESDNELLEDMVKSPIFDTPKSSVNKSSKNTSTSISNLLSGQFPKLYMLWSINDTIQTIDLVRYMTRKKFPTTNLQLLPINDTYQPSMYGNQMIKSLCWFYDTHDPSNFSQVAEWFHFDKSNKHLLSNLSNYQHGR